MRERREIPGEPIRPQTTPISEPDPDIVQTASEVHEMPLRDGALPAETASRPEQERTAVRDTVGKRAIAGAFRHGTA